MIRSSALIVNSCRIRSDRSFRSNCWVLGKVFQFGGRNYVIGYRRHLPSPIRATPVQNTDEVVNLEGSKVETLHACLEQLGRTSCLDTN